MRLYLVRHPRPLVDSGVCYGATDVVCATADLQHAALLLRDSLPKGLQIFSSPLQRCERLAHEISGLQTDLAYKTDARLQEMDFGAWEMQRWDDVPTRELAAWTDDFAQYCCGGSGESTRLFVQRVAQRLILSARSGQDQVWITHAGVIRALQWLRLQSWEVIRQITAQELPQTPPSLWRSRLLARDWPRGELAFGQVQTWQWPKAWPLD